MTRKRAWIYSTTITAILAFAVLFYGAQTAQLGFDQDDSIVATLQSGELS